MHLRFKKKKTEECSRTY